MKQLYVIHEGHHVAIDPVTGQIKARVDQKVQQWPKWAKARKILAGVAAEQRTWTCQEGYLLHEHSVERVLLEGPEGSAWVFLTRLDTGERIARAEVLFPDVAVVENTANISQISLRQSILAARTARLHQQGQFLEQARGTKLEAWQDVPSPPGQPSDRDWTEDGRGGLVHPGGWSLSAVLHGRTGGFLGFHLAHTPSGFMRMVRQPSVALAAVDSIEMGRGSPGIEIVSWKHDETPLGALLNGTLGQLLVRTQLEDTPLWWGRVHGREGVIAGPTEDRLILVGAQARAWDTFARQAWTAWKAEDDRLRQSANS